MCGFTYNCSPKRPNSKNSSKKPFNLNTLPRNPGLLCCGLRTWGRTRDRMCVKLHSVELRICYYLGNFTPMTSVRNWHWDRRFSEYFRFPLSVSFRHCFVLMYHLYVTDVIFFGAATQHGSCSPHSWGFLDYTQRRTTVGRTPLDEWSARRRDLCLTTHNNHNRQTSMPPVGFEPTISAGERSQTYALDCTATGFGTERHIIL